MSQSEVERPSITVVMPFAGTASAAREALRSLRTLDTRPGDELILVDNAGTVASVGQDGRGDGMGVTVVSALEERSPAFARNAGAARAANDWILFLDADTEPDRGLLDALWGGGIADDVGAVAGEIVPSVGATTVVSRYGTARSFLGQKAHLEHPFRPRAAAANLLVRRRAFEELGGFYEGMRAAEDTDFTWRLQEAGWRLTLRDEARVGHRYRSSLSELRRQWRGYAAGRAWLARRYQGFVPEPALRRGVRRSAAAIRGRGPTGGGERSLPGPAPGEPRRADVGRERRADRGRFLLLDTLLSLEELIGLGLSNRPARASSAGSPAAVVLIADRFPSPRDPLVELAGSLDRVRIEAISRPQSLDTDAARRLAIDYLEDDGKLARLLGTAELLLRHPWRSLLDVVGRAPGEPPLRVLAPAAHRLARDRGARLQALGTGSSQPLAERLGRLTDRSLD